ncbi:MAG: T9SS type A sorting domain-containing protein [Candidatus Marinimicrobia bacterium]|nr:T9SS type A sorting domain-containing protein [Candidatus Neomarinimicrobiota bacterium]
MCNRVVMFLICAASLIAAGNPSHTSDLRSLDHYLWEGNNIRTWIGNNGTLVSHIPTGQAGLEWPKDSGYTAVFTGGLWLGAGLVDGQADIRTAMYQYSTEFSPGALGSDPEAVENKVYSINSGDNVSNPDWLNWPVNQGAPWIDEDGNHEWDPNVDSPAIKGDQFSWCVINDGNEENHNNLYSTLPLGVEIRTSIYGVDVEGRPANTIFYEWNIRNAGEHVLDSVFAGVWMDPDIGYSSDDYAGSDPDLEMSYAYNADSIDADYGSVPPAVGVMFIRTPLVPALGEIGYNVHGAVEDHRNVPMKASLIWYCGGSLCGPDTPGEAFNQMNGLDNEGDSLMDLDNHPTTFMLTGDPATGEGWTEANAERLSGDRYFLMSAGPFSLSPGESQDFICALMLAQGTNNLNAITELRSTASDIRLLWPQLFETTSIRDDLDQMPGDFVLHPAYPNPFNPITSIAYTLPEQIDVEFEIFDIRGRMVKNWFFANQTRGEHKLFWDGTKTGGELVSTGVYLGVIKTGSYQSTIKMVLLR